MNRTQIYETIAEAYYCEPEDRIEEQAQMTHSGLCYAVGYKKPYITTLRKFSRSMRKSKHEYWLDFKPTRQDDLIRADFCTLMSLLTDKEYEEISK